MIATTGRDGSAQAQADRGRHRESEPAHRGTDQAQVFPGGKASEQLRTVRGRLLEHDCVSRQPVGQLGEDVPGAQRAARRAAPEPACGAGGSASRCGRRSASAAHTDAGGASTASCARLRCASAGSSVTTATTRSFLDERALRVGVLAEGGSTHDEDDVVAGERLAEPGAVGREVARVERVRLREACPRAEGLLPDRRDETLGERSERGPRLGIVGSGPGDERRRARPARAAARAPRPRPASAAAARTRRSGAAYSCGSGAGACQSSIGTITSAGPRRVCASCQARSSEPGTSWGRTGWSTQTGYSPARPASFPARNGSCARWRRSCCPTATTNGARLTRAVASAETAFPRPGVVCKSTNEGCPLPSAKPVAIPTTEPSCRARTNSRSGGKSTRNGTSVEPGLEKIFVIPRRRRTSNAASRTVTGVEVLAEAPSGRTWVPLTLRGSLSRRPQHPCVRCW